MLSALGRGVTVRGVKGSGVTGRGVTRKPIAGAVPTLRLPAAPLEASRFATGFTSAIPAPNRYINRHFFSTGRNVPKINYFDEKQVMEILRTGLPKLIDIKEEFEMYCLLYILIEEFIQSFVSRFKIVELYDKVLLRSSLEVHIRGIFTKIGFYAKIIDFFIGKLNDKLDSIFKKPELLNKLFLIDSLSNSIVNLFPFYSKEFKNVLSTFDTNLREVKIGQEIQRLTSKFNYHEIPLPKNIIDLYKSDPLYDTIESEIKLKLSIMKAHFFFQKRTAMNETATSKNTSARAPVGNGPVGSAAGAGAGEGAGDAVAEPPEPAIAEFVSVRVENFEGALIPNSLKIDILKDILDKRVALPVAFAPPPRVENPTNAAIQAVKEFYIVIRNDILDLEEEAGSINTDPLRIIFNAFLNVARKLYRVNNITNTNIIARYLQILIKSFTLLRPNALNDTQVKMEKVYDDVVYLLRNKEILMQHIIQTDLIIEPIFPNKIDESIFQFIKQDLMSNRDFLVSYGRNIPYISNRLGKFTEDQFRIFLGDFEAQANNSGLEVPEIPRKYVQAGIFDNYNSRGNNIEICKRKLEVFVEKCNKADRGERCNPVLKLRCGMCINTNTIPSECPAFRTGYDPLPYLPAQKDVKEAVATAALADLSRSTLGRTSNARATAIARRAALELPPIANEIPNATKPARLGVGGTRKIKKRKSTTRRFKKA